MGNAGGSVRPAQLRPIKDFGQAFLTYGPAADRIVAALGLRTDDEVLEIGPGKGILTGRLIRHCRRVYAVEIDRRLVGYLRDRFAAAGNLELVEGDALTLDFTRFQGVKVCGNLPYNISSQILFRLLENLASWSFGVFTLQREFALRLVAQPGTRDYGVPTVLFELDTVRTRLFNLPPEYFKPRPDVMSTAIAIRRRPSSALDLADRAGFIRVVRIAFAQRRKTLGNNLRAGLGLDRAALDVIARRSGISLARRAETLSLEEFGRLSEAIGAAQAAGLE